MTEAKELVGRYPKRLGRYELLAPIGTGGMATVFLGRTEIVEGAFREVALKIMHPHVAADDGSAISELVEEAKLAAQIRHPNVVPVLSVEREEDLVALVMEYVEGETLAGLIRAEKANHRTLPLDIAARILFDALAGLHAAHELHDDRGRPVGLVHRDFSPQNILVGIDGVARLTDFGVAKATSRANATQTGLVKGKIGYMAPEQALGRPIDRRCDVWAAGVVAWELLTGKRLFFGDQVAIMLRIVQEIPPRVRAERPEVPLEIDAIVAAALDPLPDTRIASAEDLRHRLMEAWRSASSIADTSEVSAFVRGVAHDKLAARRERVARVVARGESRHEPTSDSLQLDELHAERTSPHLDAARSVPAVRNRRSLPRWLVTAGAALSAGAGAAWFVFGGPTPSVEQARTANLGEEAVSLASAVARLPAREESLVVRSDRPVVEVRVGRRTVAVDPPSREVMLALGPEERGRDLDLVVFASDRSFVTASASASTGHVEVSFAGAAGPGSDAARTPPAWPRPPAPKVPLKASAEPPPKADPGLAPTPY